jgi:tetratricopeptide (TPR) repeat protein
MLGHSYLSSTILYSLAFIAAFGGLIASPTSAQEYKSYNDAMRAAAPLMRDRQYAAAQAPLEAALALAADDADRLRVYQALVPAYRLLPQADKMYEAQEFVIRHTDRRTGRSLPARDLASFLHQRGLSDAAIARYNAVLKQNPDDIAAVTVLAAIYSQSRRDMAKAAEFAERQSALDKKLASEHAERLESDAESAPRTAASIYKDAAAAWIEAGDKARAVAAVKKSLANAPEARNDQLVYFWRRGLGDTLLAAGEAADAIPQFDAALKVVAIDGYREDTEKQLAAAREAAKSK